MVYLPRHSTGLVPMTPSKNLVINTISDEIDYLVGELRETG